MFNWQDPLGLFGSPPEPPDPDEEREKDQLYDEKTWNRNDFSSRPNINDIYSTTRSRSYTVYDEHGNPQRMWETTRSPTELGEEVIANQRSGDRLRQGMQGALLRSVGLNPSGAQVAARPVDPNAMRHSGGTAFLTDNGIRRARAAPHGNPDYVYSDDPGNLNNPDSSAYGGGDSAAIDDRKKVFGAQLNSGELSVQNGNLTSEEWANWFYNDEYPDWVVSGEPNPAIEAEKEKVQIEEPRVEAAQQAPDPMQQEDVTGYYPWEGGMQQVGSRVQGDEKPNLGRQPYMAAQLRRR